MHRIIIIIIFSQIQFSFSQSSFDSTLLELEKKIYLDTNVVSRNAHILKKFDVCLEKEYNTVKALKEAKRIDYELISDSSQQVSFLWNASLIAHLNNDKNSASYYLNKYQVLANDSSIQMYLLFVMINNGFDSVEVKKYVDTLSKVNFKYDSLQCINIIYNYKKKNKLLYPISSAIVPGSGSIMNGNVIKGLNSLLLNSAMGYAIYALIQNNLYLNALFIGAGVGVKFYVGNIKLTNKLVNEKEELKKNALANSCKCVLDNFIKEYPITFK